MARVRFDIEDPTNRLTLKAILEAEGHTVGEDDPDVVIADTAQKALEYAKGLPALVLARGSEVGEAVAAMRGGVYGYVFVPFQPGEAGIMVARAGASRKGAAAAQAETPLMTLEEAEGRLIEAVMRHCRNNRTKAARILGIGRNTLWRKLKKMKGGE